MLKSDRSQEKELKDGPKKTLFENSTFKISLFRDLPHTSGFTSARAHGILCLVEHATLSPIVFPQTLGWCFKGKKDETNAFTKTASLTAQREHEQHSHLCEF